MNSATKSGQPTKPGQGGFPAVAPTNQSILLDKLNARRSTPDSEALASSDDEESHRLENQAPIVQAHKPPARRSSWLNETTQAVAAVRKGSFASSTMSPTASHPGTPSAEAGVNAWGTHSTATNVLGRGGHASGSSFPWGTGIWNAGERKDAQSRLSEVLPSPTSTVPPGSATNSFFPNENALAQNATTPKEHPANSQIPFAIPLHPTPKTYRSQSYSVGQLEPDVAIATGPMGSSALLGSRRGLPHSALQHRPSRPSMLSEVASDGTMLAKLTEDDDDESNGSLQGSQHQSAEAKTIELLTRENALLRQQQQYQSSRIRPRASTGFNSGNGYLHESVPEESDFAIDELEESGETAEMATKRLLGRRMSEFGGVPFRTPFLIESRPENRKLENVKKAFWQTQLGFGGLEDIPQSRRHSFADVPTRQGSISSSVNEHSINEPATGYDTMSQGPHPQYPTAFPENSNVSAANQMNPYFSGPSAMTGAPPQAFGGSQYPMQYNLQPYPNRAPSPHRNMYGLSQPRHNSTLHIVLFKCARADVFYIQEGTGLTVKPGDLVIVEADRGTDLGTVARDNVDWATAKELKEHYAEEQYKWLMMYSQNAAAAQDGANPGLLAGANGLQGSAVGGMGPPSQHHVQEPSSGELKPKLIKRLAQSHEIHALRDKEGNEAKAKRVCMQKVKEHGLNMEILDAEFQMDWKKLTFYYFADSYINFNSLVTDLFKIYKTRIWMSAINPASFASPSLGLQAPSGIGPGAVVVGRGASNSERRQNQAQETQSAFAATSQAGRGAQPSFTAPFATAADRAGAPGPLYPTPNYPYNPYGVFGNATRPAAAGSQFAPGMMPNLENYPAGFIPGAAGRFPTPQNSIGQHEPGVPPMAPQPDWAAFQGLSLNTR